MAGAIQRLAGSGNFEAALALQQEMAAVDTQLAKEGEAFYKNVVQTVAENADFRNNQNERDAYGYHSNRATPIRNFESIFTSASDPEQLRDAIKLAGRYAYVNPNAEAAFTSAGANGAIRAELLEKARESDGRSGYGGEDHTRSELHSLVEKLPQAELQAIYDETANHSVRSWVFASFSDGAAAAAVRLDPTAAADFYALNERPYDASLRDSFITFAQPDEEGEHRQHASDVADYVALNDPSDEAFEFAINWQDQDTLTAAASNPGLTYDRAKTLVAKANEYNLNHSLREALLKNPKTPLAVKQALNAEPKPFGDEATEAELANIADLKAKAAKFDGVWISPNNTGDWQKARQHGRKAEKLLTKADAAPVAFGKLSKRWETLQSNFAKSSSSKPSKVYESVKDRYENAVDYQRVHAVREAVANLA